MALLVLPLFLLIRGAVMAHRYFEAPGWISVTVSGVLCALCLSIWGTWFWRRLTGRNRPKEIAFILAIPLVAAFSIYSLGWLAHSNVKSTALAERWSDLHPALRLAIGAARLADGGFVVTEIGRIQTDYDRMGMRRAKHSLHYVQPDGWVHAVDLRTRGRSAVRNGVAQLYFEAMGFDTLRHSGTTNHLHVSIPSRVSPRLPSF